MALFDSEILYIRVKPDWLSIKSLPNNILYEDIPQIAIQKIGNRFKVIAIGRNADLVSAKDDENILVLNGFRHPRTIIADFEAAEKTLQEFLKKVLSKNLFKRPPVVTIHPLEKLEGGLTQVESRALQELGHRAGFKRIQIWTGKELTNDEVMKLSFARGASKEEV